MSNPYGPPIETTEDWNEALACCCGMPLTPPVIVEYESILGEAFIGGYFPPGWVDGDDIPQKIISNYTSYAEGEVGYSETNVRDHPTSISVGGVTVQNPVVTTTDNGGTQFGSPLTFTYHEAVSQDAARDAARAIILAGIDFSAWDQYKYAASVSYRQEWVAFSGTLGRILRIQKTRYRFRVPDDHLGDYYKVTWDVLYEPYGWDDEGIPEEDRPLRYSRKNLTLEWDGPGTGAGTDPSWIVGDWQTLDVPEAPGERRVINIRFEHLRKEGA